MLGMLPACEEPLPTAEDDDVSLIVENQSFKLVCELYISSCSSDVWGPDQLTSGPIRPESYRVYELEPGCWDLLAISCTEGEWVRFDSDIHRDSTWSLF